MFPYLKALWSLTDRELAWLVSIVSLAVAVGAVPLSIVADRYGREAAIAVMAVVWSAATVACGFVASYWQLTAARAVVGIGEAAFGSVGAALLATLFANRVRSTVLGAFLSAGVIGSIAGVMLGGVLGERVGWQLAFVIAGVPGLVLAAIFVALVRGTGTGRSGGDIPVRSDHTLAELAREIARPRTALVAGVGAGLQLAVVATMYAWLPSFFHRYYDLSIQASALHAGAVVLVSGVAAVSWSALADRASAGDPRARLRLPVAAALATALLLPAAFAVAPHGNVQLLLIVAGAAAMTGTIGPIAAAVIDVVHPGVRATATAMLALLQNLLGLALGPLVAGAISDRHGLDVALASMPAFSVAAALVFAIASRTYVDDLHDLASRRLTAR